MMKHLHTQTREFVEKANDKNRIEATKSFKWIGYTQANEILNKLEVLKNYPKSHRMPNLLLVGDSNNGKTAILSRFDRKNVPYHDEEKIYCPTLMIQAPPEPDEKRFYNAILGKLFAPYKTSEKIDSRQRRVINLLKELEVKVLIIDEIQHVLAGTPSKQRLFLNVIKYISNELKIPLICAGTKQAFNAIQSDSQLANRFEPKVLKRWTDNIEYQRLLISFERLLPLREESNLIEPKLRTKILALSEGLIGEISKILELATILAISSGKEKINSQIINQIDFTPPSKRKKIKY